MEEQGGRERQEPAGVGLKPRSRDGSFEFEVELHIDHQPHFRALSYPPGQVKRRPELSFAMVGAAPRTQGIELADAARR